MIAITVPDTALQELDTCPVPLPLPERLQAHGLAGSLVAFASAIRAARERFRDGASRLACQHPDAPFDPLIVESGFAGNLPEQLLGMISRVMVLELNVARLEGILSGDTPQDRLASFLRLLQDTGFAARLLDEYPALRVQVANCLDQWVNTGLEFLQRFCEDWFAIRRTLLPGAVGALASIHAGAGDKHRGGRSVIISEFSGGRRLVYKPRSMAVDSHFQEVLDWLNRRGANPDFPQLRSIDRRSYGWAEFVSPRDCESALEVVRFYERQGGYLALLYALEASDFHCENLIAAGEYPILIDLETLFHPRAEAARSADADHAAGSLLGYSALKVGLLPARFWSNEENRGIDLSGLGSAEGQMTPRGLPQLEDAGSDQMRITRKRIPMPGAQNRPRLEGAEANAFDHREAIVAGFASVYRILLDHREEFQDVIRSFADDEVRVVARPTHVYGTLLRESFHPDLLRDERTRSAFFQRLRDAVEDLPSLARLIDAEHADLVRNDIPVFTTRPSSVHIWTSSGECIANYFEETGLDLVTNRLKQLSSADLERQVWIIRASLATLAPTGPHIAPRARPLSPATAEISGSDLVAAAAAIGMRLQRLAIEGDGDASWLGLAPVEEDEWQLAPLGVDLYDGIPGVALFLAQLGAITGDDSYTRLARAALKTLRRQVAECRALASVGGFLGWGGLIYAFAHLGSILSDTSLWTEAESLLPLLSKYVEQDSQSDIVGGAAGCALALNALDHCVPSGRIAALAVACGDRLLRNAREAGSGIGWIRPETSDVPLAGFAHGNAGIAYALLTIARLTGEQRFVAPAIRAFEYERRLFSPAQSNWPDLRRHKAADFIAAWCHGAPGIGLARLRSVGHLDDASLPEEIEAALAATLRSGFGQNHCLCHGDLGNLELLIEAGLTMNQSRWHAQANRLAAAVLQGVAETGWICGNPLGLESPGLMTGLAGIGYELLRLAEPRRVPSVLVLAPPALS